MPTRSSRDVRVYPNLLDLRRYELLVRRGLEHEAGQLRCPTVRGWHRA